MIPIKTRESRRAKTFKLPKNLERLYKEGKCRECAVVVTRMDFAKILGKFTKVKIQYESSSTPKAKQTSDTTSPISNARLKSNENGMVLIHRNAYSQHPVKQLLVNKKSKGKDPQHVPNILKANNKSKKSILKDKNSNYDNQKGKMGLKKYGIVFEDPLINNYNNDSSSKITLTDLLPQIEESILPSEGWCIDYFPKSDEPKDDKVYDRIAAELEDLMYNEKPILKPEATDAKVDDFPSIMDILNDNSSENKTNEQNTSIDFKPNLESSDVEAMLLGKSNSVNDTNPEATPMEVDNTEMGNLIADVVNELNDIQETVTNEETDKKLPAAVTEPAEIENPQSPSILDEALQKGIEEHLPAVPVDNPDTTVEESATLEKNPEDSQSTDDKPVQEDDKVSITILETKNEDDTEPKDTKKEKSGLASITGITHVVFKKTKADTCYKSVTCPKNLKYSVEFDGKSVEFLGAPKYISSLEDLQVLLQIVNESELDSLYVLQ